MAQRTAQPQSRVPSNALRVRFDRFELDEANATLLREGAPVTLPPTPFAVLCALARQPAALLTKEALLNSVWGHQFVSESVLKTAISDLRSALDDDARRPRLIETVSRKGYRFIAATTPIGRPQTQSSMASAEPGHDPGFIGRAEALTRLQQAWELACSGRRSIVWVTGEPGIGKTMLIEHFISGIGNATCAHGQCVEHYGAGEPYLPVLEAIADLCRTDNTLPALLRQVAPTWLLQLPWLSTAEERDVLRRDLAGVAPDRMVREMGEALDRYTERGPLLLVLEDLHWSDSATVHLLDFIARRRRSARLMCLASFRITEIIAAEHPLNSLRHELRLHGLSQEIVLDPFSEADVGEFVKQCAPSLSENETFVRALHQRTDGVPLFLSAVIDEVTARDPTNDPSESIGEGFAIAAVPANLAAIIDHYITKLDSEQRLMLSAAATCGMEFRVTTIAELTGQDAAKVGEMCDELMRQHLWLVLPRSRAGGDALEQPFAFRHALFRQVLYERTPASVRMQAHRNIGSALERERAHGTFVAAPELASHFERAREPATAVRYYVEGAEYALAHLSPAECISLAERGLNLLPQVAESVERAAMEISLSTLYGIATSHVAGITEEAKAALYRAYLLLEQVPQHPMRRRLLHGFGFVLTLRADYVDALAVATRTEALSSALNDPVLLIAACIVHGNVDQLQGRSHTAREWIERGLTLIETLNAAPGETFLSDPKVTLLGLLALQLLPLGLIKQARTKLEQAHAAARLLGQPMTRLAALWLDALFEVRLGNTERVRVLADEMHALVDEFSLGQGRTACNWFGGWADARLGDPLNGYRRIRDAHDENARWGMLAGETETLGYAVEARAIAGDWNAAEAELHEALALADNRAEAVYLPQLFLLQAVVARAQGRRADSECAIRRSLDVARAQQSPWHELIAITELCEHKHATAEDRRTLTALVGQLPEAAGTPAFEKARACLAGAKRA
jgi:DNA-binding winged helix-turn-helix (wHTH) protein